MDEGLSHLTFSDAPWKAGLNCLGSIAFAVVGLVFFSSHPAWYRDAVCAALMVSTGCSFLQQFSHIIWPRQLLLTTTGFVVTDLGTRNAVLWDEVRSFGLIRYGVTSAVGYVLERPHWTKRRLGLLRSGYDGAISVLPEVSPTHLCTILNDWRRRYSRS